MSKTDSFWVRPCPECGDMEPVVYAEGNAKKIYHEDGSAEMFFTDVPGYICECTCCGAQTDVMMCHMDAVGAWNSKKLKDIKGKLFYD